MQFRSGKCITPVTVRGVGGTAGCRGRRGRGVHVPEPVLRVPGTARTRLTVQAAHPGGALPPEHLQDLDREAHRVRGEVRLGARDAYAGVDPRPAAGGAGRGQAKE